MKKKLLKTIFFYAFIFSSLNAHAKFCKYEKFVTPAGQNRLGSTRGGYISERTYGVKPNLNDKENLNKNIFNVPEGMVIVKKNLVLNEKNYLSYKGSDFISCVTDENWNDLCGDKKINGNYIESKGGKEYQIIFERKSVISYCKDRFDLYGQIENPLIQVQKLFEGYNSANGDKLKILETETFEFELIKPDF